MGRRLPTRVRWQCPRSIGKSPPPHPPAAIVVTEATSDKRVSVWCLPLVRRLDVASAAAADAVSDDDLSRMAEWLSADERAVAAGFTSAERRRSYVASRGLLRAILGHLAGVAPNELVFRYGHRGKPELAGPPSDLHFNMSHAHDVMLLAVTRGRRVGVDIEHIDEPGDVRRIAARFLSPADRDAIERLPADRQRAAFLRCWTRKEAYMKARGDGISRPLDDFDVTLATDASHLNVHGAADEAQHWELADLPAPRGFMAAIAVEGEGLEVVRHDGWSLDD
jgi:4'-phosphopantetheinyl transferase